MGQLYKCLLLIYSQDIGKIFFKNEGYSYINRGTLEWKKSSLEKKKFGVSSKLKNEC